MKKLYLYQSFLFILLILFGTACNRKDKDIIDLEVESDFLQYEVEDIQAYTVDEEGSLYLVGTKSADCNHENSDEVAPGHLHYTLYLHKYDLNGNLVFTHDFEDIGRIDCLAVNGTKIYLSIPGHNDQGVAVSGLYIYHMDTGIMEHLYDFSSFEYAKQIIYLDNRVYILGNNSYEMVRDSEDYTGVFRSRGERLVYYSLEDNLGYDLGINIPISMTSCEDGTLLIHSYLENEGYCLLKYDPKKDLLKLVSNFDSGLFHYFAACDQGKKLIYISNINFDRGLVLSDFQATNEEAEIFSDATLANFGIYYVKGQVYCMNNARVIVRFTLDKYLKENRIIKYISPKGLEGEPFGCGYRMERLELEDDEFALKILSQDKDYDICFMNTSSYFSYNIRKNGVFYPLNEVEGIQEYLNACFPYVKEAAINEIGDIWMLPVGVDIPGLIINKEVVAKTNIGLKNNMTYEEFYQMQDQMTQDLYQKANFGPYVLYRSFFAQYFNQKRDIDYNFLRDKLILFRKYDSLLPDGKYFYPDDEYIYNYCDSSFWYEVTLNLTKQESNLDVYTVPKLNASDKNIGTCSFLAVNPNSKNLKDTLTYIADLISYIMAQKKAPFHFKEPIPEEGTLRRSIYELYKNGEISFYMDKDVYIDGFFEVVENGADIEAYIKETERKLDKYFNE